jgi:HNH endonuclease
MTVSDATRRLVYRDSGNRCGYCRVPEAYIYASMQIDHLMPQSKGGTDERTNLWLACPRCNGFKSNQIDGIDPLTIQLVSLFNPRTQDWFQHFRMKTDGVIEGISSCGRATVVTLQLNHPLSVDLRRFLILAGWTPR